MFKFLRNLFSTKQDPDFEPLGLMRGQQLASVISGSRTFDGVVTITSGLLVSGTEVITPSGTINPVALPLATTGTLGAIKIGAGLSINNQGFVTTSGGANVVKFTQAIGDGESTDIVISHNLNTRNLVITVIDLQTYEYVLPDIVFTTTDTMTFSFGDPPAVNQYQVILVG